MSEIRKNIRDIDRTKVSLDGTESFAGRDSTGDFQSTVESIADIITIEETPIGTILSYDNSLLNTPIPGEKWKDCDGSVISPGSIYAGYRIRNLNGNNVVLSVEWTADSGGAFATIPIADLTALNVGDWVSGSGISLVNGQPAMIIDIVGTTATMNDTAATGIISSTFTNDGIYLAGGNIGGSAFDTLQDHWHYIRGVEGAIVGSPGSEFAAFSGGANISQTRRVEGARTDNINGSIRAGSRTKPHTHFFKYMMKIK